MENKAFLLNQTLKQNEDVKMYLTLKEMVHKDRKVLAILNAIQETQKEMKSFLKQQDMHKYHQKQKELELLKEEFSNQPLIINYLHYKEETLHLIEQLNVILSEK